MKKYVSIIALVLITLISYSQEKEIEVISSKDDKGFILSAKNNTNVQYEVLLTVFPKNLKGYSKPIKKLVPANSSIQMTKLLFIRNKPSSLKYNYSFKQMLTAAEKANFKNELNKKVVTELKNMSEGIVVFSKDGCSRCHYTTSFLLNNEIDFRLINTSTNNSLNKLMWELVKAKTPSIEKLTMPVILVKGKLSYNIENLKEMVSNLNK